MGSRLHRPGRALVHSRRSRRSPRSATYLPSYPPHAELHSPGTGLDWTGGSGGACGSFLCTRLGEVVGAASAKRHAVSFGNLLRACMRVCVRACACARPAGCSAVQVSCSRNRRTERCARLPPPTPTHLPPSLQPGQSRPPIPTSLPLPPLTPCASPPPGTVPSASGRRPAAPPRPGGHALRAGTPARNSAAMEGAARRAHA